ncbi:MAG TPA: hypothetical protein VIC60_06965 [Thermomicrobiales bacterium]
MARTTSAVAPPVVSMRASACPATGRCRPSPAAGAVAGPGLVGIA